MIFAKKKILVLCDDRSEDRVISIFAGCLANHDRAHRHIQQFKHIQDYTHTCNVCNVFVVCLMLHVQKCNGTNFQNNGTNFCPVPSILNENQTLTSFT
jgi:hypothetical protein